MAIPSSGAVSFNDIQTEFGGTNPISLSEYYGVTANVPGSGAIKVSDFYGQSADRFWYSTNYPIDFTERTSDQIAVFANNDIFVVGGITASNRFFALSKDGNTTRWWHSVIGSWSATPQSVSSGTGDQYSGASVALARTSGNIVILGTGTGGQDRIMKLRSNGAVEVSANTPNGFYSVGITDANVYVVGFGTPQSLPYIAKLGNQNLTVIDWRRYFPNTQTFFICNTFNYAEDKWFLTGIIGTDKPLFGSFDTSGTTRWLRYINVTGYGYATTDGRPDNANSFVVKFNQNTNTIMKITDTPSIEWTRRLPAGYITYAVPSDPNGNVYVAAGTSVSNGYFKQMEIVKLTGNTSPTVSWANRFSINTALLPDNATQFYAIDLIDLEVTETEILVMLDINRYEDDGDGGWIHISTNDSTIFRLPVDGTKTGSYGNYIYSSNSAPTLSSPPNPTLTTASITFNTTNTINLTANTNGRNVESNTLSTTTIS